MSLHLLQASDSGPEVVGQCATPVPVFVYRSTQQLFIVQCWKNVIWTIWKLCSVNDLCFLALFFAICEVKCFDYRM